MTQNLPALLQTQAPANDAAADHEGCIAPFAAQLIGQDGARRGLRAGPLAIEAAQTAYRQREYSGQADRRLINGHFAKAAI